jgi:hypothetical protein
MGHVHGLALVLLVGMAATRMDLGDLSWLMGLFDWLRDRNILPAWIVDMLRLVLNVFVPSSRGARGAVRADDPEVTRTMNDLQQTWLQFVAGHPLAQQATAGMMPGDTTVEKA